MTGRSKDKRAEHGVGWEAASAGLVFWPDESRHEPATGKKYARPWPVPGYQVGCTVLPIMGRKHLDTEGWRAYVHFPTPGPEQQLVRPGLLCRR